MIRPPVFFVVGPVGHGKTTVREIIVKLLVSRGFHIKGGSCSDVIDHFLALRKNISLEAWRAIPKEERRPQQIEAGDFLCGQIGTVAEAKSNPDFDDNTVYRHPSALIRTLYMNGYNVIDGVRRRLELQHAKDKLDWNGIEQLVIHVTNPRAPVIKDNSGDLTDLADELVTNDGTPEELETKILAILLKRYWSETLTEPTAIVAEAA